MCTVTENVNSMQRPGMRQRRMRRVTRFVQSVDFPRNALELANLAADLRNKQRPISRLCSRVEV